MRERVAIIGSGIAGMGAAWQLRGHAEISMFEKLDRSGGHTNTVVVDEEGIEVPIDTGFIVFNHATYPNLVKLFAELGVETKPAEMSFSVQHLPDGLEYNGMGPGKLFAQRRNIANPRFLALVWQILKFFRVARRALADPEELDGTLAEFARRHGLGADFLEHYLVPMSSAVWSTEPGRILEFPAASLVRFFQNHGFLGVTTHHRWFTVSGGSKSYRDKLLSKFDPVRLPEKVVAVRERADGAGIVTEAGGTYHFDRVVIATHADEALAMLPEASIEQRESLGAFPYQRNTAVLHRDESVMPRKRIAWASWNYRVSAAPDGRTRATTHYWMNALQGVSKTRNYFVSLNADAEIDPAEILYRTVYEHPVFTSGARRAQERLPSLNTRSAAQRVFFCGSYFRYGFHEDAYASAVDLGAVMRPVLRQ